MASMSKEDRERLKAVTDTLRVDKDVREIMEKVGDAFKGKSVGACGNAAANLCVYVIEQMPVENRLDMAAWMACEILARARMSIIEPAPERLPGLGAPLPGKPS